MTTTMEFQMMVRVTMTLSWSICPTEAFLPADPDDDNDGIPDEDDEDNEVEDDEHDEMW